MGLNQSQSLVSVLAGIPVAGGGDLAGLVGDAALREVAGGLAALLRSVRHLRSEMGETWGGSIHRRLRWRPCGLDHPAGSRPGTGSGEAAVVVTRQERRAGWKLTRAVTRLDGLEVTHELAQWVGPTRQPALDSVMGSERTGRVRVGTAPLTGGTAGASGPGRWGGAGFGSRQGLQDVGVYLTPALLRRWAQVSGDDNDIHLSAGRAASAGLDCGADEVVAHGTVLLACCVCLGQWASCGEARFVAPLPVPPDGCVVRWVREDSGDWVGLEGPAGVVLRVRPT